MKMVVKDNNQNEIVWFKTMCDKLVAVDSQTLLKMFRYNFKSRCGTMTTCFRNS